jgi:hypothetical protein
MNKLRDKFSGLQSKVLIDVCEQITDDFSIKFLKWYNVSKYDFPNEMTIEEKQQYFKNEIYGK